VHAVVIPGAGLIGCEFADDLAGAGYEEANLRLALLTELGTAAVAA
jgi:NADPH-dependent 2,4-dienoyl-CoA reductase/sulfur reductase-like enzyme